MSTKNLGKYLLGFAVVTLTVTAMYFPHESFQKQTQKKTEEVVYQRPELAPNGNAWPLATGYIEGFKRLNRLGRSTIQVENYQSGHDFYVKLVHSSKRMSVRHAFVKRFESFKFAKVTPGSYYLLYKNLGTGESTKSDVFSVEEKRMYNGVKYTDMRISMYHVKDGNFEGQYINEEEFAMVDGAPERRTPSEKN
ncbi:MAG: hypothetical protein V4598_02435 [Bdellovibrionota bacterium]